MTETALHLASLAALKSDLCCAKIIFFSFFCTYDSVTVQAIPHVLSSYSCVFSLPQPVFLYEFNRLSEVLMVLFPSLPLRDSSDYHLPMFLCLLHAAFLSVPISPSTLCFLYSLSRTPVPASNLIFPEIT